MAMLEDLNEKLTSSLTRVSPSFVLSQGWEQLFKQFFAKGTRDEALQLLPEKYQPVAYRGDNPASQVIIQPSQAYRQSFESVLHYDTTPTAERSNVQDSTSTQEESPTARTTPSSSLHSPGSISQANLQSRIQDSSFSVSKPNIKPSTRVSRAIQAMSNSKKQDPDYYDATWSGISDFIDYSVVEKTATERYRRIQGLHSRNGERGDLVKYAQRFSLVIGAQELQVIEKSLLSTACSRGISIRSLAINKLAEFLQVDRKRILDENKRRAHYVSILEKFGPGALLLLGEIDGNLSLWERHLTTSDVDTVCEYAAKNLEGWVAHGKKLNEKAANLIVGGLRACGWDGSSHWDTAFMTHLAKYLKGPDTQSCKRPRSRKRRQSYSEEISKRHHHDRSQDFVDDCTNTPDEETVTVTNSENSFCEDRLNDTLLDWDFDVNLSLDWDQFIENQITEALSD